MCKRTVNDGLAFASKWAPSSNMYKTNVLFDGISYGSAEQCYQHQKALFENKDDLAELLILISSDPFECKKIGVEVGDSLEWEATSESMMTDIISAKFHQNRKLEEYLCNTEESQLYEATNDEFWGVGLPIYSKDALEEKGKGQNILGLILMAFLQELLNAQSPDSESAVSQSDSCVAVTETGTSTDPDALQTSKV